ncbi:MAG: DUF1062 domain-containing protein [Dongiaceae bacterium]
MSRNSCEATARLQFHLSQAEAPKIRRHCARCKVSRPFICSGNFRINANGKSLDAWLIYRCERCDCTWNYALHERVPVKEIDAAELNAMMQNDRALADRYAFDIDRLTVAGAGEEPRADAVLRRIILADACEQTREIVISIVMAVPCRIRLDRALCLGLSLQRSDIASLGAEAALAVRPETTKALRRPAADGQEIVIDLSRCPGTIAAKCRRSLADGRDEFAIPGVG